MKRFRFYFIGRVPSKANYKRISHRRVGGEIKPFIMNNREVLSAQREALYQFHLQKLQYGLENFPIDTPVKLSLSFYLRGRIRQRDIDNAEKFVGDVLEKAEILKRDSLIYLKERVEKRLGIKSFEEMIVIEIEKLSANEVAKMESRIEPKEFPQDFFEFLKKIKMEIPDEA